MLLKPDHDICLLRISENIVRAPRLSRFVYELDFRRVSGARTAQVKQEF